MQLRSRHQVRELGYAADVAAIYRELGLRDVIFVRHSVGAMIGVLAAAEAPDLFARPVLEATGHCPNLSAPDDTFDAIRGFVGAA